MCNKVKFKSDRLAWKHGKGINVYYCMECKAWHTTSMPFARFNKMVQKRTKVKKR